MVRTRSEREARYAAKSAAIESARECAKSNDVAGIKRAITTARDNGMGKADAEYFEITLMQSIPKVFRNLPTIVKALHKSLRPDGFGYNVGEQEIETAVRDCAMGKTEETIIHRFVASQLKEAGLIA